MTSREWLLQDTNGPDGPWTKEAHAAKGKGKRAL